MRPLGLRPSTTDRRRLAVDDYNDPYLELVHLLTQASGLEHSLMAAYLYAGFSIKPRYAGIRGEIDESLFGLHRLGGDRDHDLEQPHTLLGIAVEEMQHLSLVNQFLGALDAPPVLTPHAFPMTADIYPFAIDLRPLTRPVAATFLWVEAQALKFGDGPGSEPKDFQELVARVLDQLPEPIDEEPVSHLGSLYHAIMTVAVQVAEDPPPFLDPLLDWPRWLERMDWILGQGEIAHYQFFRTIFTGEAFDPSNPDNVWRDPSAEEYPACDLSRATAWRHARPVIVSEEARRLAWLGDLHYWLVLGLLDRSYRSRSRTGRYQAVGQMTRCLWSIGLDLADSYNVGFPFDPMGPTYGFGRDRGSAADVLIRLAEEAIGIETGLDNDGLLPSRYATDALPTLIAALSDEIG